jgi:hypothetical protein
VKHALLPELKLRTDYVPDTACWIVKEDVAPSGDCQEMTTPIMFPKDENYLEIKEVMKRFKKHEIKFNKNEHSVHVHVNFPSEENTQKLISLFARLEPILNVLNSRSECKNCFSSLGLSKKVLCSKRLPRFEQKSIDYKLEFAKLNIHSYFGGKAYMLRTKTDYGTVEFRSVIDLTWDPEINVQNILLSQTIVKIANMKSKPFVEIMKIIEKIMPLENFLSEVCKKLESSRKHFPRPTKIQVADILQLLEDVAKTDDFFTESKTQPDFKLLQANYL